MFACTEAGQAILGEIRKEQEVILLTEPDKTNYTITPDSKRWKTTKKTAQRCIPAAAKTTKGGLDDEAAATNESCSRL